MGNISTQYRRKFDALFAHFIFFLLAMWSQVKSVFPVRFQKKDILTGLFLPNNCYKQQLFVVNITQMSHLII